MTNILFTWCAVLFCSIAYTFEKKHIDTFNSYYEIAKEECHDISCIRENIDHINNEILKLLAQRTAYVKRAGDLKCKTTKIAQDRARVERQEQNIIERSNELEIPLQIVLPTFRAIVENSILFQQEYINSFSSPDF